MCGNVALIDLEYHQFNVDPMFSVCTGVRHAGLYWILSVGFLKRVITDRCLLLAGVGDLRCHPGPQEHHRVQPVTEAGPERRPPTVDRSVPDNIRHDVTDRHRHRHQRDGGPAVVRSSDSGGPGRARCGNLYLHHLHGDPPS